MTTLKHPYWEAPEGDDNEQWKDYWNFIHRLIEWQLSDARK
jgi:hypothetical protein